MLLSSNPIRRNLSSIDLTALSAPRRHHAVGRIIRAWKGTRLQPTIAAISTPRHNIYCSTLRVPVRQARPSMQFILPDGLGFVPNFLMRKPTIIRPGPIYYGVLQRRANYLLCSQGSHSYADVAVYHMHMVVATTGHKLSVRVAVA